MVEDQQNKKRSIRSLMGSLVCLALFIGAVSMHLYPEALEGLLSKLDPASRKENRGVPVLTGGEGGAALWSLNEMWGERKKELDTREAELTRKEMELQGHRKEIEGRIRYLEAMRGQVTLMLKQKTAVDEGKVKKLVDLYSHMQPQKAAKIINSMNEDLAVAILGKMRKISAAEIMNQLELEKVQKLSEKFIQGGGLL